MHHTIEKLCMTVRHFSESFVEPCIVYQSFSQPSHILRMGRRAKYFNQVKRIEATRNKKKAHVDAERYVI